MRHTTLYRKWRPRRFGQVVGQEPVVRTLRRAIETGRVSHAYLFSGPRGTGKTSTAKVLAMGLNCERGPTPEPCGECESCRSIVNNSSMDVLEMDAASNRGIDEIRELRDRVNLAPAAGRMKVYIIDEVHMLTTEAFNALLKMLEEPPEHVVFVLATTEKHRVLPTIISRCQSFDFRRPGVETLSSKLAEIAEAEGIEAEPEALTVISREGRGSFRDAEGLLDQLSSFSEGRITVSMVRELLGNVGPETLIEATDALHERRPADALRIVDRLSSGGRDLGQFAGELISHLRNLMLLPHAPEVALAEIGADERGPLQEQAERVPTAEVVRMIEVVGETRGRIRRGGDPKLELELAFLKLARDYAEPQVESLIVRLETLEKALENGAMTRPPASAEEPAGEVDNESAGPVVQEDEEPGDVEPEEDPASFEATASGDSRPGPEAAGSGNTELGVLTARWESVLRELKDRRQASAEAVFRAARPAKLDGNVLELEFSADQDYYLSLARHPKHTGELQKVLEEVLGKRFQLEFRVAGGASPASGSPTDGGAPEPESALARPVRDPVGGDPDRSAEPSPATEEDGRPENRAGVSSDERGVGGSSAGADGGGVSRREPSGGDDIIRDQREVFALARERFGPFGESGGS
jgi:DNA polymerase-3 subunit gamma/tau